MNRRYIMDMVADYRILPTYKVAVKQAMELYALYRTTDKADAKFLYLVRTLGIGEIVLGLIDEFFPDNNIDSQAWTSFFTEVLASEYEDN